MDEVSSTNLLTLPLEIKVNIAENYLKCDLINLVCCSKEYHEAFKPFLWRQIYIPWHCLASSYLILPYNFTFNIKFYTKCIHFCNAGDLYVSWGEVSLNFNDLISSLCNIYIEELFINNVLEDEGIMMISEYLPSLRRLTLKHCSELSVYGWERLNELERLETLNIKDCFLRNTGLSVLTALKSLEEFHLDLFMDENVLITDVGLRYLDEFTNLKKLTLSNSAELEFDPESLHFLDFLSNLTELSLENTILDDEGLDYIAATAHQLQKLNISYCNELTDSCLASLLGLQSLDEVKLHGVDFSDEAVEHFLKNAGMVEMPGKRMILRK